MLSDNMMEYYFSMGQDSLASQKYDEAMVYFHKAALMGAPEARDELYIMGVNFASGDGVEKDEKRAARCFEMGSSLRDSRSDLELGRLYLEGIDGVSNPRRAKRYLSKACDAGSEEAALLLAKIYDEGLMGKVNHKLAFSHYLLAAERGNKEAMLMTGLFYAQGDTVPKDIAAAEMWIRRGRGEGSKDGDATLRVFLSIACTEYVTGTAGRMDPAKAMSMAEEAERLGDTEVFLHLGEAYIRTGNMEGHNEKAFECFRRAAMNHVPAAYAELGICFENGIGTDENLKEASSCFKKAAEGGSLLGMTHYGLCLTQGSGLRKNTKRGMEWLMKAALAGDEGARRILKEDFRYDLR
jgi:TPR repeat protein